MIPEGEAAPRVKPKPMYVVFHVEFDGIVRNIHFRQDITMKFFKNYGTIFCPNLLQRRGRNNFTQSASGSAQWLQRITICSALFFGKLLQKFKKYTAFETLNSEYCLIKIKEKDHPYNSLLKVLLVEQLGLLHFELKNDFFPGGQTMELKFLYKNTNKIKYFLKISSSAGRREAHNLKS